jgi:hypothetical protein
MVGQSRVFDSMTLDNEVCTDCGDCTANQFWCPAEAIYDAPATETPFGTRVQAGKEGDGKKYSECIYEYKEGDDPYVDTIPENMPFNLVTRFGSDSFPISGANSLGAVDPSHDEPFLEIGHPPHIQRIRNSPMAACEQSHRPGLEIEGTWAWNGAARHHQVLRYLHPANVVHSPEASVQQTSMDLHRE